jgi:hypothetical protein
MEEGMMQCCASCGIAGVDEIKLKDCSACHLVRYCGIECQKEHRPQHKRECKKRAAELRDEILFKQPESNLYGDCPICCLPLSNDPDESTLTSCCFKRLCDGCNYANKLREAEGGLEHTCPFCRKSVHTTDKEDNEFLMKRIEANDPVAMFEMGAERYREGDYKGSFKYWTRAAALGDVMAHHNLERCRGG